MTQTKKAKKKSNPKELMDIVVDKELLNERKNKSINNDKSDNKKEDTYKYNDKWDNMTKDNFITKEINGEFYARYKTWSKRIWIGPYASEKELNKVIDSYVKETKKEVLKRDIKNIHSIILNE